jgi:hypothetical protein
MANLTDIVNQIAEHYHDQIKKDSAYWQPVRVSEYSKDPTDTTLIYVPVIDDKGAKLVFKVDNLGYKDYRQLENGLIIRPELANSTGKTHEKYNLPKQIYLLS